MRFKTQSSPPPPQVDLIPMLTVMMGVLAFFVVVTTTLSQETLVDIQLPAEDQADADVPFPADPFIVELVGENEVLLNGQPTDLDTLATQMEAYLSRNPNDTVFLLPHQDLPYEQVMQFLGDMRRIGGNRVSLAIEAQP
ncbi:biopolymer transporter ExbD [Leptolyngbya sp. BL0902]|uniref:ExbD/TolR family protein n=1 Tax=Leptolyngbya sp. BL0902 TaxID=1115757 RepID=UPI0018E85390|nr:biopolymer transporter ExbD [Leptolyngbya sp. BL0902]QQE63491.1 biopolymer transporter ExbD [Leptolyngbya sp. BL0902]